LADTTGLSRSEKKSKREEKKEKEKTSARYPQKAISRISKPAARTMV
jgi:hypothetical protein